MPLARAAPVLQRLWQVSGDGFQFSGFWGSLRKTVQALGISRKGKAGEGKQEVLRAVSGPARRRPCTWSFSAPPAAPSLVGASGLVRPEGPLGLQAASPVEPGARKTDFCAASPFGRVGALWPAGAMGS